MLFFFSLTSISFVKGQLINENFNYSIGNLNGTDGWAKHNGIADQVQITSGSLTFSGYSSSGLGNKVTMSSLYTEDLSRSIGTTINSGSIYASFLVNFSDVSAKDFEFHFMTSANAHRGRFFSQKSSENLKFGVSIEGVGQMASDNYNFNTTYLIIIKITFQD